jgi:hypothetical protein
MGRGELVNDTGRALVIPIVAALVGAATATATYGLVDEDSATPQKIWQIEAIDSASKAEQTQLSGARP